MPIIDDTDMGTREQAVEALVLAWKAWTPYRQPFMGTRAEHRRREAAEREIEARLVHAAAHLACIVDYETNHS